MRKSILTIALIATAFISTFAGATNKIKVTDYIITDEGITYVAKLKIGVDNTIIAKNESGEKLTFSDSEVKAFRKNGKEYKRFYKVIAGSKYVKRTYLQRMFTRAGYSLFRNGKDFYVYSGDQLELKINKDNYKVVLSFFFPKFNMLYSK